MLFGHLPEVFLILLLGLLVFGPRKMIEMGSSLGRTLREFREATKDLSWQELTGIGSATETPRQTALSKLSQLSQAIGVTTGAEAATPQKPTSAEAPADNVIDAAADPVPDMEPVPPAESASDTEQAEQAEQAEHSPES
jgi:sec-independent protein translocase protein TatA